jgi:hypothetical protein
MEQFRSLSTGDRRAAGNLATVFVMRAGVRIARQPRRTKGVQLSSAVLVKYEGTYEFREGSTVVSGFMGGTQRVTVINGQLYLNALPLIPQSETRFDSTGTAAEFFTEANDTVTRLVLSQTEGDAKYDRKP